MHCPTIQFVRCHGDWFRDVFLESAYGIDFKVWVGRRILVLVNLWKPHEQPETYRCEGLDIWGLAPLPHEVE